MHEYVGAGSIMGWRPHDVYSVTVSEFWASWSGWQNFHCKPAQDDPMTRDELDGYIRDWDPNA